MKKLIVVVFLLQVAFVWQDGGGWLGVQIDQDVTENKIKIFEVTPKSPAEKGGLKVGDFVKSIDGKEFKETEDLINYVKTKKVGDKIKITVERDDEEKTLEIKLGKKSGGIGPGPNQKPGKGQYKPMIEKGEDNLWKEQVGGMEKDEKEKFEKVLKDCSAATARVTLGGGGGSGFLIKGGKYLITAGHVAKKKGAKLTCILPDGTVFEGKTVFTAMKPVDIAILEVINKDGKKLPFVDIEEPQKGEKALMLGFPGMYGMDKLESGASVVGGMGSANAKKQAYLPTRVLVENKQVTPNQITIKTLTGTPPLPGNSGGPLFNMDGKAIGIVVRSDLRSMGFVTPSGHIKKCLAEVEGGGSDEDGCLVHKMLARAL